MIGTAAHESGVASNSKLILPLLNLIGSVGTFLEMLPSHCDVGSPSSSADDVDTLLTQAALFGFVVADVDISTSCTHPYILFQCGHFYCNYCILTTFCMPCTHSCCGSMPRIQYTFH